MASPDPRIFANPAASQYRTSYSTSQSDAVLSFHRSLASYASTPLIDIFGLAANHSDHFPKFNLYLKSESERLTLPSFKILGATWAIQNLLTQRFSLPPSTPITHVSRLAQEARLRLVAASEGNWGRAVAHTARALYSIPSAIWIPDFAPEPTRNLIRSSGADCVSFPGSYDAAIQAVQQYADEDSGLRLLCLDNGWPGCEQFPLWVTEGYLTMLCETSAQLSAAKAKPATHIVVAVGVGSWAHAVVAHYKSLPTPVTVIAVEPEGAACLQMSLRAGCPTPVEAKETIMCGMCCGTVSSVAWPVLREGVDLSISVTDQDAHEAVLKLESQGTSAGPCGAATLAGLLKTLHSGSLELGRDSVVVLFSTEGPREYNPPWTKGQK